MGQRIAPQPQDLNSLSDQELEQIVLKDQMSQMSDEELQKIVFGDLNKPEPSFMEKAGSAAMKAVGTVGEYVDRYTGAPTRAAVYEATKPASEFSGLEPLEKPSLFRRSVEGFRAFGKQIGEPTEAAPTGEMIARERLNIDDTARKTYPIYKSASQMTPEEIKKAEAEGGHDKEKLGQWYRPFEYVVGWAETPTKAEAAGTLVEAALDPTIALSLGANAAAKGVAKGAKLFNRAAFGVKLKPEAEAISKAARAIGAEATPGQLFDSSLVQKLESLQAQSQGTIGGMSVRKTIEKNTKAARETAENLLKDRSFKSGIETGVEFENKFMKELSSQLEPAEQIYGAWEDAFRATKMPVSKQSIVKNLGEMKNEIKFSKEGLSAISEIENGLAKVENLDDLKQFRTSVGRSLANPALDGNARYVYSQAYSDLSKARGENLKMLARSPQYKEFSKAALNQLADADMIYRDAAESVQNALLNRGKTSKLGPKGTAEKFFEDTTEVKRIAKVLQTGDSKKIERVARDFPLAFDVLRQGKMEELFAKAQLKGKVDIGRLTKALDKMPEESKIILFGKDSAETIKDLKTYYNSLPPDVNPSKTALAQQLRDLVNPWVQGKSAARSAMLRAITAPELGKDIFSRIGAEGIASPLATSGALGLRLPKDAKERRLTLPKEGK